MCTTHHSRAKAIAAMILLAGSTHAALTSPCGAQQGDSRHVEYAENRLPNGAGSITVKFEGGTVSSYVKAVQAAAAKEPFNVVVGPGCESITLRPIELNMVSVSTAMKAMQFATDTTTGDLRIGNVSTNSNEAPTFAVNAYNTSHPPTQSDLDVLSIAQLTRPTVDGVSRQDLAIKADVVLSAIEMAMPTNEEPARIKYHEDSQLLIIQGSPLATNAVQMVIKTMLEDQRHRLGDAGVSLRQMIESKARVERANIQLKRCEAELSADKRKLDQITKLAEQGSVSAGDVQDLRTQVEHSEAAVLTARSELEEATALMDLLTKTPISTKSDASDELASLRKLVEDQAAQIKALTDELRALRQQKSGK